MLLPTLDATAGPRRASAARRGGALILVAAAAVGCSSGGKGGGQDAADARLDRSPTDDRPVGHDGASDVSDGATPDHAVDAGSDQSAPGDGGGDGASLDAYASGDGARRIDTGDSGPASPIAVQVPASSAPSVPDWSARCSVSGNDNTSTPTCWVIEWGPWTYWALSNVDNREALLIVAVDADGTLRSQGTERPGTRYLWRASVDDAAMTVTFHGQGDATVTLGWDDLGGGPIAMPQASDEAVERAPSVDGGWSATCVYGPGDLTRTVTCPVLRWGRWTYWALSNADNRQALYVVGVDEGGALEPSGGAERSGTRYLFQISVDLAARTVTFHGQQAATVTAGFDDLRIDQTSATAGDAGADAPAAADGGPG